MSSILIVEDEIHLAELMRAYLEREGYKILVASDGQAGLVVFREKRPSLVLLDLMLPGMDGWEFCRQVRLGSRTPIIMLTALTSEEDKLRGLEIGADDYITKPFSPRELVARVRAVLRRTSPEDECSPVVSMAELSIDYAKRAVNIGGIAVDLTVKEFDLLWALIRHPGQVFSRQQLLDSVWGYEFFGDSRTVDTHIKKLRQKLELVGRYSYVQTVWGVGYKFEVRDNA
ncbi:MAG: Transcriptional regulatory protein SrrA [Firmicutes bacterium]|nr:Transcriptional regulatory protein SrrA [Bacillota bacterium]MBT9158213.1 Transcriptional regulatory protein SrrA [Bacillota bacterium]